MRAGLWDRSGNIALDTSQEICLRIPDGGRDEIAAGLAQTQHYSRRPGLRDTALEPISPMLDDSRLRGPFESQTGS